MVLRPQALLEKAEQGQRLVMLCSSLAVLAVMLVVMAGMMVTGRYGLDAGMVIDVLTITMLCTTGWLAWRGRQQRLQALLLCMSVPLNLLAMLLLDGQGAWPALLLLSITPIMWGLFAPLAFCMFYTAFVAVFFNIYLDGSSAAIMFNGADETGMSAVTLSLIAFASMVAAVLPRRLVGSAYSSLNKAVVLETLQRERLAEYAHMSSDWHMEIDEKGIIVDFFGAGDAVGTHWRELLWDWSDAAAGFEEAIRTRQPYSNVKGTLKVGDLHRKVECSGSPIFSADGTFKGYRAIAHDITARIEVESKLHRLATTDRLTGLENRHAFNLAIEALQARRSHGPLSVFYIDLDKFKELNDRHGHGCGDIVLTGIGQRLKQLGSEVPALRVFRLGGDEFCCLLDVSSGLAQTREIAAMINDLIAAPIPLEGRLIDLTASIGAAYAETSADIAETLEQADAAVYEAKASGGGCAIVPEGEMRMRLERRIRIQRDFTAAIANGDIRIKYQPIFDVASRKLLAVEALARWDHPKFGEIPPSEFIQIAEASRDIIALGQYIMRRACTETAAWMERTGERIQLNVNVSPNEMLAYGFARSMFDTLDETGFPADLLELEITERGVLANVDASREVINEVRRRGSTVALDDFGTGHSSLSRLESLPIDRIKVDRSFFVRAEQSDRARQILGIIAGMSRILNVDVVAEGIQTESQMRLVEIAGFAKVQGYLLGMPGALDDLQATAPVKVNAVS